jgi:heat shock protein HslJ
VHRVIWDAVRAKMRGFEMSSVHRGGSGRRRLVLVGIAAALTITACSSDGGGPQTAATDTSQPGGEAVLVGVGWSLSPSDGDITTADIDPTAVDTPKIAFAADGQVSLYDGCNYMTGSYSLAADRVSFEEPWTSTAKACTGDPVSTAFGAVLKGDATFSLDARTLRLTATDGTTLVFDASA